MCSVIAILVHHHKAYSIDRQAGTAPAESAQSLSVRVPAELTIRAVARRGTMQQQRHSPWQEFIAFEAWPAVNQTGAVTTRDTPDNNCKFGDPIAPSLVWQTFGAR